MRVLFILPGEGGGGGSHSVVQESHGLMRLGAEVALAKLHPGVDFTALGDRFREIPALARLRDQVRALYEAVG